MSRGTVIHWFRKGLRLHDNPALLEAIRECEKQPEVIKELRPIFILDPLILDHMRVGPNRWRFLQQSLSNLDDRLKALGSALLVIRGKPEEVFPKLFKTWNVKCITFENDIEPYAKKRDEQIEAMAKDAGIKVIQKVSHTLYSPAKILNANMGKVPLTYQKFVSVAEGLGPPPAAVDEPKKVPPGYSQILESRELKIPKEEDIFGNTNVPTLEELGLDESKLEPCLYPGGEAEALQRMQICLAKKAWICDFEKPNTSPNSLIPSTTVLSPYLKFGCLSPRLFFHELNKIIQGRKHSKPPVSLVGQMYWREFYYVVGFATPNYDRMVGNSICCQIPWGNNQEHLKAWTEGRTGYPFIDAIMTQLRKEGWIHHLARHAVACFLTRGDLWISWEEGQKVFEELLLDADWALNAGNWMWLSASAFFHQYFRVYSPVVFGKKTDKFGDYIKKYLPILKKYPVEYIYEPWNAPLSVQKAAGCIIGTDYPRPIVKHEVVSKENIAKMNAAYKANKANKGEAGKSKSSAAGGGSSAKQAKKR
ncbi:Hypothetical predicted protein [Cloeon dipterum]|uniref:Photolyase/cryptochrome alpha/beta domain-containing protein n=2 Tax=Cloeon dipterum TaxID=197152 RepID=A0A8S1CCR4_9INSE|nr:Hypothetical predicted protein [Cloeon dipterum]